jgi:hypothetical protein
MEERFLFDRVDMFGYQLPVGTRVEFSAPVLADIAEPVVFIGDTAMVRAQETMDQPRVRFLPQQRSMKHHFLRLLKSITRLCLK